MPPQCRTTLMTIVALCVVAQVLIMQEGAVLPADGQTPALSSALAAAPLADRSGTPPPPLPPPPPRPPDPEHTSHDAIERRLSSRGLGDAAVASKFDAGGQSAAAGDSAPRSQQGAAAEESAVHVVIGADRMHWPGVIAVVNSIRANTKAPGRLRLHLLTPIADEAAFRAFLQCNGLAAAEDSGVEIVGFDGQLVPLLKVQTKLTNLESPLNFARFYMHRLFPSIHKVVYLDADVIVRGDIAELFDGSLPGGELCAATHRKLTLGAKGVASLRNEKLQSQFHSRYGRALPLADRGFNAGVFVFNLKRWSEMRLTAEVEHWIAANNRDKLYMLGSQPPLVLAIYGAGERCQQLEAEWHLDCLGCMGAGRLKTPQQLDAAKLLHWNGPNKPFKTTAGARRAHRSLFDPYAGRAECHA
jgi:lipopolysaccharide biosynthesis glycosyltransferase